jgi:hypothetical protein
VRISAAGFGTDIPAFVSVLSRCGRKYCGGTFLGTLTAAASEEE